ncbi:MAG: glycosyltransferase family 2 protein [Candidatus Asgardarchaeia archaeon]
MGITYEISVITTLYNYRDYIVDCIESFLKQNFKNSEMIIVDDNSIDNPYPNIKKYISDRVKYIKLRKNCGYSHAKNVGINMASADILVMLDADDMTTENGIALRYEKIKQGFDFVHGPVLDFSVREDSIKTKESRLWQKWLNGKKDASCYKLVHAQSVMLKKDIHRKIGLYDESLRSKSDREMWARVFNHRFKIGYVDKYVSMYRRHKRQMHRSKEKLKINKQLQRKVLSLIEKRKTDLSGVEFLR